MIFGFSEVCAALRAEGDCSARQRAPRVTGWSVDTRTLEPGDLFFALRGPNHDGHAYIDAAFEKGPVAVVAQASGQRPAAKPSRPDSPRLAPGPAKPGRLGARGVGAAAWWE